MADCVPCMLMTVVKNQCIVVGGVTGSDEDRQKAPKFKLITTPPQKKKKKIN